MPHISFKVEKWSEALPEMKEIFPIHWEELALNKDAIKMSVFEERYAVMESQNALLVVTARTIERLVGYFVVFLLPHLHYQDAGNMAHTDMYFLLPEFRNGSGAKLLMCVQDALRLRGIKKMYLSTKIHKSHTELFQLMGFTPSDIMHVKLL